ncbi:Putative HAD superfamily protein [Septoria linicola]|uniref:HAD superfamily protein n=1 Tax=Septoria linicola TaxID=215465 RepID=A0A9Q9B3P1_9PEZI|nr:putative HAD superfamily protein [Septoria linicola]USW57625.1 Putative HAD superfamily protein [Septoria linicola]
MANRKLKRPTRLVLDYDGTLTVKDTMAVLGTLPKQPTKLSWDEIVEAYLKDYEKYQNEKFPWQNYDATEYSAWLASRDWAEQNSARRVQDSGYFKGVTQSDIRSAVQQALQNDTLQLRPGWTDLFQACIPSPSNAESPSSSIEILSVNWSSTAIRLALEAGAQAQSTPNPALLSYITKTLPIHANEIRPSGFLIRPNGGDIRTNIDKLAHFRSSSSSDMFTVYIGDSSTDFDCLCAADLGIWIYDVSEDEYEKVSEKVFAPLKYVPPMLRSLEGREPDGKELFYWAREFGEVVGYLTVVEEGDGNS